MATPNKTVTLAPEKPPKFHCPECAVEGVKTTIRFLRSLSEQWGCVVTRHDVYSCRKCRTKLVSTNGGEPEIAADWI